MERISQPITKTVIVALDALFKSSKVDIRLHDLENVPDQPVLFVINHFTRLETIFMPYIIKKYLNMYTFSLAHYSFFGGGFGKFIEKLGGVSTKDPDRDVIFTRSMLTGENSTLIFPEGQMVKDKKLVEKGKYMIYNTGIRRPPHTGAANVALNTEFYREKMRYLKENNFNDELKAMLEHFRLTPQDLDGVLAKESLIIPVNITYYPIRVHNNAINRLVERFVKNVSERMEEELEIEGTMLLDGVDIDINFGKPIHPREYLNGCSTAMGKAANRRLYLDSDELKKEVPFNRPSIDLMQRYMDAIYGMTTINSDHIFAYMLTKTNRTKIHECDLKNRAFLAIEQLKEKKIPNLHTNLYKNQFHIITDDEHQRFNSFIEAGVSDGLITMKDHYIIKNKKKFSDIYEFHTIRKDNIFEVFTNELEPLPGITRLLIKSAARPAFLARRKIRGYFLELDQRFFEEDYEKYFLPDESKPKNIGRPFFMKRWYQRKGIILIHGYMAAPEEMRVLADIIHGKGYAVYGVRLRGHGTAPEDLDSREWIEWYNSVNRAYIVMENSVRRFAIAGFSTGAGLALLQASQKGDRLSGVISISAPLKLQNISSRLTSAVVAWNKFLDRLHVGKGKMEFIANTPENPHINYLRNPVRGVNELGKLMDVVEKNLPAIQIPALIIQGSNDPVVNPVSAMEIFKKVGTTKKEIYEIYSERHGIVRGDTAEKVAERVKNFLESVFD
ncbi:MAG: hypothetical protein CVV44_17740 [Spirochaetae bacterium HGW-Spirochaetae-1]|jgi:esterase/lipase/1-acyl-sn-glycerol-3-phosphate acyltransferase|nr:MAG: hypothetical protein CVV44_17740 [Spirochaetae bacterium HGW-Spirochaetae-1]